MATCLNVNRDMTPYSYIQINNCVNVKVIVHLKWGCMRYAFLCRVNVLPYWTALNTVNLYNVKDVFNEHNIDLHTD